MDPSKRCTFRAYSFTPNTQLYKDAIISHVLLSETVMPIKWLMRLREEPDGFKVVVRWPPVERGHFRTTGHIYQNVPQMLLNILNSKSIRAVLPTYSSRNMASERADCVYLLHPDPDPWSCYCVGRQALRRPTSIG